MRAVVNVTRTDAPDLQLQLAYGSELLSGANQEPILFIPSRNTYLRLSSFGARTVSLIAGRRQLSRGELILLLRDTGAGSDVLSEAALDCFLGQLRTAGALTSDAPVHTAERKGRFAFRPRTRLPVRIAVLRRDLKPRVAPLVVCAMMATTVFAGLAVANALPGADPVLRIPAWFVVAAGVLLHGILHEIAHTLTIRWYGVPIRGAGVALLYWLIPVFYVDRTDSYRVAARRPRVAIALAGPVFDALACALTAVLAQMGGAAGPVFASLCTIQVLILLSNLNPLLPTDGYHALEAGVGELNVRGRVLRFLLHAVGLRPLPVHLARFSARQKAFYMGYGFVALLYIASCVTAVVLLLPMAVKQIAASFR
jgi:putative peptide zinc metalloprotease protein